MGGDRDFLWDRWFVLGVGGPPARRRAVVTRLTILFGPDCGPIFNGSWWTGHLSPMVLPHTGLLGHGIENRERQLYGTTQWIENEKTGYIPGTTGAVGAFFSKDGEWMLSLAGSQ